MPSDAFGVVLPIGPGKETALDTLESINVYCPEPHITVVVDDCTQDGTYEAIQRESRGTCIVLRNERPMHVERLVHSLCLGYRYLLDHTDCQIILRIDQDALLIKPNLLSDAQAYASQHKDVGIFGVYEVDYNRPRSFTTHKRLIDRETGWLRRITGRTASYAKLLELAEARGYQRGDNVFGGAYLITRACL